MSARCPSCGARAARDAAWCTLCHAPLGEQRIRQERPVAAAPEPVGPRERPGRHAVPDAVPAAPALVGGHVPDDVVEDLVGRLAASTARSRPPVTAVAAGPARRLALAGGGIAVGLTVALILMWLVGHLL